MVLIRRGVAPPRRAPTDLTENPYGLFFFERCNSKIGVHGSPSRLKLISIGGRIRGFLWIGQFHGWDIIRFF
jgi:hypothetical protein